MMHVFFSPLLLALLISGCTPWRQAHHEKPHVIVLAIESLNFESASCSEEGEEEELFLEICKEAMRFTHFFSPSTLSQPSLATLLTGLDITEHKVFHNGNQGITAPIVTVAEKALQNGYRTAFFSGGPPILSKSGLQQGFETFDDDFLKDDSTYVPALENLKKTIAWMDELAGPGLVAVYLADLQFPTASTFTDEGKERGKSSRSQREELAESLNWFVAELKRKGLWSDAYIVVVGLNGDVTASRKGVLWRESLFRDNVHVPLFLKTPIKHSDGDKSFDGLLGMKDLGKFLQKIVDSKISEAESVMQQLDEWIEKPVEFIETRSDWRTWWFGLAPEVSVRTADYLVFPRQNMIVYHTLVDKNETTPLRESQVGAENLKWLKYRYDESFDRGVEMKNDVYEFLQYLRYEKLSKNSDFLKNLPASPGGIFSLLRADKALRDSDWAGLARSESPIYKYVAAKNMPGDLKIELSHSCDRLFYEQKRPHLLRKCRDPLFLALLDWEKRRDSQDALFWEKSFMRKYRFYMHYKRIAYMNLYLELNWDVDVASLLGPSLAELYLSLPEKAPLKKRIESYKIPLHVDFI